MMYMEIDFLLDNIRNIREDKNLTQQHMAKVLSVTQPNYARWETKVKIIPLKKLNMLCNYFYINMDYVVGITNKRIKMNNNNILNKKDIGLNIRKIRLNNKLSQSDLAKILNTTQSVISTYEMGKTLILTAFLIQLCLKFNVSMDQVCNRK